MKRTVLTVALALLGALAFAQEKIAVAGQIYKPSDTGPAGGIVFYDKGNYSEGWRYLEAAPAETEFTAEWGAYGNDVANTLMGVGCGKQNTQIILERLDELGETGKAAQICAALDINGYKDWFLPSLNELILMYRNLKPQGLGGFGDRYYWSSTQHNNSYALYQRFNDGSLGIFLTKRSTFKVRAVRAF